MIRSQMNTRRSTYRNEEAWNARRDRDAALIDERLDAEQKHVLQAVPAIVQRTFPVEFVMVVGSLGRGTQRNDSDMDIYIEALGAPDDPDHAPVVPDDTFQVLIVPAGVLLTNCRAGEPYALGFARDGLIAEDSGSLRSVLIALDEEGIVEAHED